MTNKAIYLCLPTRVSIYRWKLTYSERFGDAVLENYSSGSNGQKSCKYCVSERFFVNILGTIRATASDEILDMESNYKREKMSYFVLENGIIER